MAYTRQTGIDTGGKHLLQTIHTCMVTSGDDAPDKRCDSFGAV